MWSIADEQIEKWNILNNTETANELHNSNVLITGATGLIGQAIVKTLVYANRNMGFGINIIALVRNLEKADKLFGDCLDELTVLNADINNVTSKDLGVIKNIDYVIHGASITSSKAFIEQPVETILTGIQGTDNILQLARETNVKSMVYLSSMEVYGTHKERRNVSENDIGYLNPLVVRNSYPESKRLIECLCCSYASEYNIPVKIVRLAQTFGPGVEYDDGRVFMDFARCAIEDKDIILHTAGLSERMYLYVYDAVEAIFFALLKGETGHSYNAANKHTYCSILEMAELVKKIANESIDVRVLVDNTVGMKYLPTHYLYLDTSEIERLGWKPRVGLEEMYKRLISSFEDRDNDTKK